MKGKLRKIIVNVLFTLAVSAFVALALLAIIYGAGSFLSMLFNMIVGG